MKKIFFAAIAATLITAGCSETIDRSELLPTVVAHRGCHLKDGQDFYIPENCPAGVWMAARYGYPAIEMDVKYTLDSVMVIMHDATINRTMRLKDGYAEIPEPVKVVDTPFEELRTKYVLASTDPALRTPIPTLEEELEACREAGIMPMLHSSIVESYELSTSYFQDKWIAFGSSKAVPEARNISDCLILIDPGRSTAEETLVRLGGVSGRVGMSTMKFDMLDSAYVASVKEAGYEVQASIFKTPHELKAVRDGVTIQLTDFYWKRADGVGKKVATWKKHLKMAAGEEVSWPSKPIKAGDFLAYTLDLTYCGALEVEINGRHYSVKRNETGTDYFGLRLYKDTPSIHIKAAENTDLRIHAEVFDL